MSDKEIRFVDAHGETMFTIPDGGNIVVDYGNGEQVIKRTDAYRAGKPYEAHKPKPKDRGD